MSDHIDDKKSILIVDDEPDICEVLKRSLDGNGYRISTFTDPVLALEHFKLVPDGYDVLITDVRMPQLSGFELARSIKSLNADTRVIVMTAFEINRSEFEKVLPSSSIDAFLTKPASVAKVRETVENL
jgi:two-component system response regulator ChvI